MSFHGWLVMQLSVEPGGEHFHTWLVMVRGCSMAPTVMTFLAVPGDCTVSALPEAPLSSPPPELPAEKTKRSGCEPGTLGNASRTAAS